MCAGRLRTSGARALSLARFLGNLAPTAERACGILGSNGVPLTAVGQAFSRGQTALAHVARLSPAQLRQCGVRSSTTRPRTTARSPPDGPPTVAVRFAVYRAGNYFFTSQSCDRKTARRLTGLLPGVLSDGRPDQIAGLRFCGREVYSADGRPGNCRVLVTGFMLPTVFSRTAEFWLLGFFRGRSFPGRSLFGYRVSSVCGCLRNCRAMVGRALAVGGCCPRRSLCGGPLGWPGKAISRSFNGAACFGPSAVFCPGAAGRLRRTPPLTASQVPCFDAARVDAVRRVAARRSPSSGARTGSLRLCSARQSGR